MEKKLCNKGVYVVRENSSTTMTDMVFPVHVMHLTLQSALPRSTTGYTTDKHG